MAPVAPLLKTSDLRKHSAVYACASAESQEERKTMTAPQPRSRQRKPLAAGVFQAEIGSFRLHLAAEGKAAKTVRTYGEAVQWFAAAHLMPQTSRTRWQEVDRQDVQRWMVWLLGQYSDSYASNQYRALQQFFKWWAEEEQLPDPMARLRPPKVTEKLVPVFTSGELSRLEKACQGRAFAQRRDAAVIAVFRATGIRVSELAGSATTPAIRNAVTWTCRIARSRSAGRAARGASSGSATTPPGAWTGTSGSGPGTRRRGGRSCG
jgi:Phage integrase, N-terminal SAM-like domain